MKNDKSQGFGTFLVNFLLVCFLIGGAVGLAVIPVETSQSLYQAEQQQSLRFFGEWPTYAAERWQVDVELAREEFLETLPHEEGAAGAFSDWVAGRVEFLSNAVHVVLQRWAVVLFCLAVFLPAGLVSLYCGHLRREAAKQQFSFTSPYRMRARWACFKLLTLSFVVLLLFPATVCMLFFPLLIGGMALYSGSLVSGLQKEI